MIVRERAINKRWLPSVRMLMFMFPSLLLNWPLSPDHTSHATCQMQQWTSSTFLEKGKQDNFVSFLICWCHKCAVSETLIGFGVSFANFFIDFTPFDAKFVPSADHLILAYTVHSKHPFSFDWDHWLGNKSTEFLALDSQSWIWKISTIRNFF